VTTHGLPRLVWLAAGAFAVVAVATLVWGPIRLDLGPIRLVSSDRGRILFQAALALLAAVLVGHPARRWWLVGATLAVLVAGAIDSSPRRVGDGAEYVAMAANLAAGRPPGLSADDRTAIRGRLSALDGFADVTLDSSLVGGDGRTDFMHFWLYSLAVAPVMALTDRAGWNVLHAFTIVNVVIVIAATLVLGRYGLDVPAVLLVSGPLLWWIDKAHAEVFLVTLVAMAMLLAPVHRGLALGAATIAAIQHPAAAIVLAAIGIAAMWETRGQRRTMVAVSAALLFALVNPLYYRWHLGVWSPLLGTDVSGWPGLRTLVTPLVDPNLGLVIYAPMLVLAAVIGTRHVGGIARWRALGVIAALLLLFARVQNVNHGGTPGMSRYGLWVLACALPLVGVGLERLRASRPTVHALVVVVTVASSWFAFRPALPERYTSPSALADLLWSRWPGLDNPLPEVFAERVTARESPARVPAGVAGCAKVLVRGDGAEAWWPFPCEPRESPPWCTAANALCYVNQGTFATVPPQPAFTFDPAPEMAWTVSRRGALDSLRARLGAGARSIRLGRSRRVESGRGVSYSAVVEGPLATAVWVLPVPGQAASIGLRLERPATVEIHDESGQIVWVTSLPSGRQDVPWPFSGRMIAIVADSP
jgi:hypothetical protein